MNLCFKPDANTRQALSVNSVGNYYKKHLLKKVYQCIIRNAQKNNSFVKTIRIQQRVILHKEQAIRTETYSFIITASIYM